MQVFEGTVGTMSHDSRRICVLRHSLDNPDTGQASASLQALQEKHNFSAQELSGKLEAICRRLITTGFETDISISVYFHGVEVVSLSVTSDQQREHSSHSNGAADKPLYMSYSTTKGLVGATALTLVDCGRFHPRQKVVEIWPSFDALAGSWLAYMWIVRTILFISTIAVVFFDVVPLTFALRCAALFVAFVLHVVLPLSQRQPKIPKAELLCWDALAHRGCLQDFNTIRYVACLSC